MTFNRYLARRLLQAIPTGFAVLAIVFSLSRLTGDPATLHLGDLATPEAVEELRAEWGLNDPVPVQFTRYVAAAVTGDLGRSLRYSLPVTEMIRDRLGASLLLAGTATLFSLAVSIPLGLLAAVRWGSGLDVIVRFLVFIFEAVPRFYLAILLLILFGLFLRWLPTGGYGSLAHLILPAVTLATPSIALMTRLTRSSAIDVLTQDYIRTARSKGLKERVVIFRHVFRASLLAPFTMISIQAAQMVGGAVIVEAVFSWPGLGRLALDSVYTRDFPVIQGVVLFLAALVILTNVLVDVAYAWIDPRIRYQ
jgi:ABC-type dipeptide/oligopeptide/nickel transport system permease component